MTSLRFDNAHLIDPSNNLDGIGNVLMVDGMITDISPTPIDTAADRIIDATGLVISPGWIDMHVHLRLRPDDTRQRIRHRVRLQQRRVE